MAVEEEDGEGRCVDDSENPISPAIPVEQQEVKAGQPNGHVDRIENYELAGQKVQPRQPRIFPRGRSPDEFDVGETMADVPDDKGAEDDEGGRRRGVGPGRFQVLPHIGQQKPDPQARPEPEEVDLIEEPEAHDEAEEKPETGAAPLDDEDENICRKGPKKIGEGVHLVDIGLTDDDRGQDDSQAGQSDGRPSSAEFPGDKAGQDDRHRMGQGRQNAEAELGDAEERPAERQEEH